MFITDLHGKEIKITNLHASLDQAQLLIGYFSTDERFRDFDEMQKAYWQDIVNKLQDLSKLN